MKKRSDQGNHWRQFTDSPSALERLGNRNTRIGYLYLNIKYDAKRRGIEFTLSPKHYASIWRDDCSVPGCGNVFTYGQPSRMTSRSIDRIDPSIGYADGNVRLICYGCNASASLIIIAANRRLAKSQPSL